MFVKKLEPYNIYFANFETQYDVTSTLIRIQEYYESPSELFRNKVFDLDSYMDWCASEHKGVFSYFVDWVGFNVPGEVIRNWYLDFWAIGYRNKEKELISKLPVNSNEPWYLIATHKSETTTTINHEISHALWYLDGKYRASCENLINQLPNKSKELMIVWLKENGYCDNVINDEITAYLSTVDDIKDMSKETKISKKDLISIHNLFKEQFDKYSGNIVK